MAEGLIPTRELNQLLRKQTAGRGAEVFQELDGTMPYPEFKAPAIKDETRGRSEIIHVVPYVFLPIKLLLTDTSISGGLDTVE